MRTTLTLDDDVSAQIEQLRRSKGASLRDLVNEALRRGLREMTRSPKRKPFRVRTVSLGRPVIDIDNVAEAIAYAEGDDHR